MFGRVLLLLLPSVAFCFDAVVWSSGDVIDRKSPPELSKVIELATLEKPLVLFVLKDFQLADFSRHANVYGEPGKATQGLKKWIASSKGYAAEWLDEAAQLPAGRFVEYKGELSALTEQPVIVVHVDSFAVIDDLADNILQSLDRPYTAVLSGEESLTTHAIKKRVSTSETRGDVVRPGARDAGDIPPTQNFPVTFPQNGEMNKTCLLFIGQIGLQVFLPNVKADRVLSNMWVDAKYGGSYMCSPPNPSSNTSSTVTSTFTINLTPNATAGNADFKVNSLNFKLSVSRTLTGYWSLSRIEILDLEMDNKGKFLDPVKIKGAAITKISSVPGNSSAQASRWEVSSVDTFSFACSVTPPAWIVNLKLNDEVLDMKNPKDPNMVQVGLVFGRFQLQPFHASSGMFFNNTRFSNNVDDCVATFSVGSWMGILVGLIFVAAFLFAMTMLNSVQTMDRFDDPKQKQIVINFKE